MVGADRGYAVYTKQEAMQKKKKTSKQDDLYTHTMNANEVSGNAYSCTIHKQTFHKLTATASAGEP